MHERGADRGEHAEPADGVDRVGRVEYRGGAEGVRRSERADRLERADIAVVGAGAAGLFASIWAGRARADADSGSRSRPLSGDRASSQSALRIVALDGARRLGAKILVAGGGRCNVTHDAVDERDFNGSTPAAIRRVLSRFGVDRTISFFREVGVELKREQSGKLFPTTDDAHTVLEALLREARRVGVEPRHPAKVRAIRAVQRSGTLRDDGSGPAEHHERNQTAPGTLIQSAPTVTPEFEIDFDGGQLVARRVILATGGQALPKSGSDGSGFELARSLGHSVTPLLTPALVPLIVREGHWTRTIQGVACDAEVVVRDRGASGPIQGRFRGSVLCTHFGLSGPAILDASRHLLHANDGSLSVRWLPEVPDDRLDAWLLEGAGRSVLAHLRQHLPERLAKALLECAGIDPATSPRQIPRERRMALVAELGPAAIPVKGSRGDTFAEATAGGVPLRELHLDTLESRLQPGLHLCGEVLDVDGRIGGFNFQWAWASGFIAGSAAVKLSEASCPIE